MDYGKALSLEGLYNESNNILFEAMNLTSDPFLLSNIGENYKLQGKYYVSKRYYRKAITMVPNRIYPRYLMVLMLLEKGDSLEAKVISNEILNSNEKIVTNETIFMKSKLRKVFDK